MSRPWARHARSCCCCASVWFSPHHTSNVLPSNSSGRNWLSECASTSIRHPCWLATQPSSHRRVVSWIFQPITNASFPCFLRQTSESKISYATVGAKTKEDAAKILDPLSAKYKNIAGVEEKLTYEDTYAQENVSVDMEKVDFKALQQISGTMVSGDTSKGISMKQTQTLLEAAGFKEAK